MYNSAKCGKVMRQHFLVVPLTISRYKSAKKGRGSRKHDCSSRIKKDCGILPLFTGGNEEIAFKWLCEIFKHWKWYVFEVRRSQELSRILLPYQWTCVQFIDAKVTFPVLGLAIVKRLDREDSQNNWKLQNNTEKLEIQVSCCLVSL